MRSSTSEANQKSKRISFFAGKSGALEAGTGGAQDGSGEESSEEAWQPNWGLTLFSALNPNVITTGTPPPPHLLYSR